MRVTFNYVLFVVVIAALLALPVTGFQFIDRIVRPCAAGIVPLASVKVNPLNTGNIDVTPCTGGGLTVNGVAIGFGTVTSVSVVTANGFSGSVATATTTPAITINNPTALVATTSIASPFFVSAAGNPADAGAVRLGNTELIAWEKAAPGTDWTLGVNASDVLITNAPFSALTLTGQGLTPGRVVFAGTAGLLSDDADLTFATDTLTVTKEVINSGTLTDQVPGFTFTATMPTVITAPNQAVLWNITSAGSSAQQSSGLDVNYLAGYTGASTTRAAKFATSVAGTGASLVATSANIGAASFSTATTAGSNIGAFGSAQGGNQNAGTVGRAIVAKNSATNIGGAFYALNTGTTPVQVGVFGGLMSADPTFEDAAALFDNGSTTFNIFVARDNGTAVFTIADGGVTTDTSSFSAASYKTATNCADSAGAAACGSAAAGSFVIDAASTSTVVSTTAVTANSQIFIEEDSSLGARLGVTCNTQSSLVIGSGRVTARTTGASFTVTLELGPTTNPACFNYTIIN